MFISYNPCFLASHNPTTPSLTMAGGIEIPASKVAAAANSLVPDKPVVMINLIRFKAKPDYSYTTLASNPPPDHVDSGMEAYFTHYVNAFYTLSDKIIGERAELIFLSQNVVPILGSEGEKWDACALLRYKSLKAFRDLTESKEYEEIALPHRLAAIEDYRFLTSTEADFKG